MADGGGEGFEIMGGAHCSSHELIEQTRCQKKPSLARLNITSGARMLANILLSRVDDTMQKSVIKELLWYLKRQFDSGRWFLAFSLFFAFWG
jgi:hypothetical protein